MNRIEALRILGLDDDASSEDVKTAYKEMVQILHPDRFATSKKLQDRATEQFKNLQEAYDFLTDETGRKRQKTVSTSARAYSASNEYEARLAGIAAARTQLVAQRDLILDERRNGIIIAAIGVVIALFLRRVPIALALGSTAIVYGLVRLISAQSTVSNLSEHIKRLNEEQKIILEEYENLENEE